MKISEHANYLLNEYGRLQFDYAAYCKPYGESLRNEARNNLEEYIAELEDAQRWIPVGERLPEEEGWYYAGVLGRFGDHYTHDVYFYAEDAAFRWKDCEGDKVYCWLGGVPALPQPPEVQDV